MTISVTNKTILDGAGANVVVKTVSDSSDSTVSPAHFLADGVSGALVSPATSGNQATANTALAAIQTSVASVATNTGSKGVAITQALTVTASSAYSTGFVLGGKQTISGFARTNSGSGLIQQAYCTKKTALSAPVDLFIFNADPSASTFTDKVALAIDPADLTKLAGVIHCVDLVSMGTPQMLQALGQALAFKVSAANTSLFVVPVVRATETYASTDAVQLSFSVIQD